MIAQQLTDLTGVTGKLQPDLRAALNDSRKQLVAELEKQSEAMMALTAASNYNQACKTSYYATLGSLPLAIQRLVEETRRVAMSQRVIKSLVFHGIKLREEQIHPAHAKTFAWIFQDSTTPFKRWLACNDGIFWVNGKAGSGKSTLMKFLATHRQTKRLLRQWSGSVNLIVASFYFWTAGHDAQKSQLGLMKSLLYQIFRQCPDLIPSAWFSKFDSDSFVDENTDVWSRQELSDAVDSIITHGSLTSRFCFFVDGLDEYADAQAGDHYALIQYLDRLTQSSCVKICVSSRPWTVFKDRYDKYDDLKFVLQDLTSEDMRKYAAGQLLEDERFRRLASHEPQALLLANKIQDKAEGVFLWVTLVTRSLKRGLSEHDDTKELERRLAQTPSDLIGFFRSILRNIDDNYRDYTMRALQIAVVGLPMPLGAFQYVAQEVEDQTYAFRQELNLDELPVNMCDWTPPATFDAEAKVNKWCRDLLEVQHSPNRRKKWLPSVPEGDVVFLHRTVHEFLSSSEVEDLFQKYGVCRPSPRKAYCRMYLAYAKSSCSTVTTRLDALLGHGDTHNIMLGARECELKDQETPLDVLNELERFTIAFESSAMVDHYHKTSVLRLAVRRNLLLYIDQVPDRDVLAEPGILWDALLPPFNLSTIDPWDIGNPELTGLPMITKLLAKGCCLNDIRTANDGASKSPWQNFMEIAHKALIAAANRARYRDAEQQFHKRVEQARFVTFLLEHGADPDANYEIDVRVPGRSYETRVFLMKVFGGDKQKVDALQNESRKTSLAKQGQPQ